MPVRLVMLGMVCALIGGCASTPPSRNPTPFTQSGDYSQNLAPFTKWTGMLARLDTASGPPLPAKSRDLRGLPFDTLVRSVNELVNSYPYIEDKRNWGKTDYWQTPDEFLARGGDCEDFAITKYAMLEALGVPEEQLRVTVVYDKDKSIPHTLLTVHDGGEVLVLDNQTPEIRGKDAGERYQPLYSINRHAWWRHIPRSQIHDLMKKIRA